MAKEKKSTAKKTAPKKKTASPQVKPTLADTLDEIIDLKGQGACIPMELGVSIVMPHERTHPLKSGVGTAFFVTYEEFSSICARIILAQAEAHPELMAAPANSLTKSTVAH